MPDWSASPLSSKKDREERIRVKSQRFLEKPVVVNNEVNWGLNPDTPDSKVKGTKGRLRILLLI